MILQLTSAALLVKAEAVGDCGVILKSVYAGQKETKKQGFGLEFFSVSFDATGPALPLI